MCKTPKTISHCKQKTNTPPRLYCTLSSTCVFEPKPFSRQNQKPTQHTAQLEKRFLQPTRSECLSLRVVSHLFTGSLAGIGKLPALAGWYIRYGMYGIFCTVRFSGSSILWNFAGTPLKRGAWSIKKGAEASKNGVPAKCTIPKVLTKFSFGIG